MSFKTAEGLIATIGATDGTVFAANPGRLYMMIQNTHASQDLFVRFGTGAATTALGRKIAAGGVMELGANTLNAVPGDEVHIIGSGSGTTFYAVEGNGSKVG